jgi:hypothetical protein
VFFDISFTIPANTAEATPQEQAVKLTHGIIHRVEIRFPSGCAGLTYLKIIHGLHQIYPTNPDGSFRDDDQPIGFNDYYEFFEEPYKLTLVGWNLDDTYNHTLEVRFGILPPEVLLPEEGFLDRLKNFLRTFGVKWHTDTKITE